MCHKPLLCSLLCRDPLINFTTPRTGSILKRRFIHCLSLNPLIPHSTNPGTWPTVGYSHQATLGSGIHTCHSFSSIHTYLHCIVQAIVKSHLVNSGMGEHYNMRLESWNVGPPLPLVVLLYHPTTLFRPDYAGGAE